jgi:CubicO group peptidase (beta-lactamase class C family)
MLTRTRIVVAAGLFALASIWAAASISALPATGRPEDVGLSSDRLKRIPATIQRHIDEGNVSGAVTLVARNGRVAHLQAHGYMDIAVKKPMPTNAVFRIMSMTKPVVGAAILMMMEEGRLRLSDPVSRFIPEYKHLKVAVEAPRAAGPGAAARDEPLSFYTVPATREITVRDLLTHTSGLVSGGVSATEAAKIDRARTDTIGNYLPKLATVPLAFQPGSRWAYSPGAGFDALGRIVEVASDQPLDRFLRERIFQPLGMKDTFFVGTEEREMRAPLVYQRTPNGLVTQQPPAQRPSGTYFGGGGGLVSTAEDYARFGQMLLNGGQLDGQRLLGRWTVDLMRSVHVPDSFPGRQPGRAFGLSVQVVTDPVAAGYSVSSGSYGWIGAWGTHSWIDPTEKLVGIMLVQTSNPNRQVDRDFETAVMQAIVE